MQGVVLALIMAVIVKAVVDYGKIIVSAFASGKWITAVTHLISIALGIGLCLAADADLFAFMDVHFRFPWLGVVLTGVIISRGTAYVSDFVGKMQKKGDIGDGEKDLPVSSSSRKG